MNSDSAQSETKKRCCSPDVSGKRCTKPSNGYDFCPQHHEKARPLYNKYKKFEKENEKYIEATDYSSLDIETLLKIYSRLHTLYHLRMTHHTASYMPGLWDEGHKFYLEILLMRLMECEEELSAKFASSISTADTNITNTDDEELDSPNTKSTRININRVKRQTKEVVDNSSIWLDTIPKLIKENQRENRERKDMILKLYDHISNSLEQGNKLVGKVGEYTTYIAILVYFYYTRKFEKGVNLSYQSFYSMMGDWHGMIDLLDGCFKHLYTKEHADHLFAQLCDWNLKRPDQIRMKLKINIRTDMIKPVSKATVSWHVEIVKERKIRLVFVYNPPGTRIYCFKKSNTINVLID